MNNTKLCFCIKKSGYKELGVYGAACANTNLAAINKSLPLRYAFCATHTHCRRWTKLCV
ncbi:hypothetical protein HMPREF3232_01032 [Fannyhessea vaginae]|nr:hypothetical protein HMPREF3232_01032 [Fannyhessea vaginae]